MAAFSETAPYEQSGNCVIGQFRKQSVPERNRPASKKAAKAATGCGGPVVTPEVAGYPPSTLASSLMPRRAYTRAIVKWSLFS